MLLANTLSRPYPSSRSCSSNSPVSASPHAPIHLQPEMTTLPGFGPSSIDRLFRARLCLKPASGGRGARPKLMHQLSTASCSNPLLVAHDDAGYPAPAGGAFGLGCGRSRGVGVAQVGVAKRPPSSGPLRGADQGRQAATSMTHPLGAVAGNAECLNHFETPSMMRTLF